MLIAFEGIDGAGKTSVSQRTAELLRAADERFVHCAKRPRVTDPLINAQLDRHASATWHPEMISMPENPFSDEYWILLVAAWYVGLERQMFRPWIDVHGGHVVLEKWFRSLVAKMVVQGGDPEWLLRLFRPVRSPDLVVLLDVDPAVTRDRRRDYWPTETGSWAPSPRRPTDPEVRFREYQAAVRAELLQSAKREGWIVVENSGGRALEQLANELAEQIRDRATAHSGASGRECSKQGPHRKTGEAEPCDIPVGSEDQPSART